MELDVLNCREPPNIYHTLVFHESVDDQTFKTPAPPIYKRGADPQEAGPLEGGGRANWKGMQLNDIKVVLWRPGGRI